MALMQASVPGRESRGVRSCRAFLPPDGVVERVADGEASPLQRRDRPQPSGAHRPAAGPDPRLRLAAQQPPMPLAYPPAVVGLPDAPVVGGESCERR
jgi:hypothetical protein